MSEEVDELDALLQRYEQQAAADAAAVQVRQGGGGSRNKRLKTSAADKREEALSQPLGADNKGFKLLAAMGYQQGQRIGKAGTGLAEPLPLLLKQDKLGLGAQSKRAAAREQQRQRELEAQQRAAAVAAAAEAGRQEARQEYQQRAAAAAAARRLEGQLRKAQQVCETLDTAAGMASSVMWQQHAAAAAAGASLPGGGGADELLEALEPCHKAEAGAAVRAGRAEAAEFARLYQHHAESGAASASEQDGRADGHAAARERELEAWLAQPAAERLAAVLEHLRSVHSYCLYCGCRYEDAEDLQQHCPGPSEQDHD